MLGLMNIAITPYKRNVVLRIKRVFVGRVQIFAPKYMHRFVGAMVGPMKMSVRRTGKV